MKRKKLLASIVILFLILLGAAFVFFPIPTTAQLQREIGVYEINEWDWVIDQKADLQDHFGGEENLDYLVFLYDKETVSHVNGFLGEPIMAWACVFEVCEEIQNPTSEYILGAMPAFNDVVGIRIISIRQVGSFARVSVGFEVLPGMYMYSILFRLPNGHWIEVL